LKKFHKSTIYEIMGKDDARLSHQLKSGYFGKIPQENQILEWIKEAM
jgi:hypothetical protein